MTVLSGTADWVRALRDLIFTLLALACPRPSNPSGLRAQFSRPRFGVGSVTTRSPLGGGECDARPDSQALSLSDCMSDWALFFFLNTRFIDGMKHYLCVPPPSTVLRAPAVLLHAHLEQNKLMINPLEIADSMSFALYHSLAWTQPGLFASRWLQFNHSCIRNFQTGIRVGLSTCRQAHSKTSRNRCVNLPSATPSVRYIFSGKGSDDRVQSLEDIARLIQNKECSRIVVMSGAGISTPSGIPDFRSSGSGLYDNLQQYDIPYPEAIFEINYFFHNPKPFFALAKQLYPGNCKPNFTHYFVRFLHQKELLLRMYTQNIDGLERMAGIPPEKLVEAHGTFATATCTVCLENFSWEQLREDIMERKVPHCPSCSGVIKPDIVFFGEQLPANFHRYIIDLPSADLLIILGTSLEVEPFASLSETVRKSVPRVLFNQDLVGSVTRNPLRVNDVVELGDIIRGVKKFSKMLGWNEEINDLLAREHAKLERDNIERSK